MAGVTERERGERGDDGEGGTPHLVARGGGAIVNFTSISANVGQTSRWLYPVGKAALVQLTRNMAMDLAADNIRVNSVSPGWTWSKVMVGLSGDDRAATATARKLAVLFWHLLIRGEDYASPDRR